MKTPENRCPKCGRKTLAIGIYRWSIWKEVFCCSCGYSGKKALTRRGAVKKWNRRANDENS